MKHIKKLFIFLVLVLSFVLASCDNKKIDINITLNYGFETETKTVTYDEFDGEMLKCQRDGYKLVGWYTDNLFGVSFTSKENIKSNVNLYAKWEAIDYTISYILNGGTNNEANPATYTVESDFVLATPEKEGFSFMGWYSDYQFNTKVTRINRGSTGNITLYAKWVEDVIITFTVDGQTYNTINVTRGEEIKFPTNPIKEGYTFDGWYIGNTKVTTLPTNEAVNVIARFNINSYKVKYYKDSNLIFEEDVYYNNKANGIANNPFKDGYTFDGWYNDSSFTTKFNFEEDKIKANTNLYAKFNPIEYTITYVLENNETNSANNPAKYTIEANTITLDKATKEGYKFIGWYSDAKYQNKVETINNGSTGNITLYALFEIENYQINYELDGGLNSANNPTSYSVETETVTLDSASKNGYEFKGWYLDSNFSTEIKKIEKGTTSNKTLYAKFEVVNYSITYALDGGTNNQTNPSTYTVEDEIVLADAVKEGYDFTGWVIETGAPITKIEKGTTGAITLNATFKIKTFDVTYYYGDNKLGSEKVNYNELVGGLEANPSKTGYEFKGWYKDSEFKNEFNIKTDTVKDNINLYARLDLINYEIEYNLNGGLNNQNNPSTYTVEDEVVFQKASKEGCSFVGWVSPTGAPITKIEKGTTGKISLIATFEDEVIITFVVDNEVYKIINITNGDELKFPSVPVKEGYTFDNWYVGENVFIDLNVDASISVVAKFSPNRYKVTYYVDKTEFGSEYVEYNSYVGGLEANPTKNGYTFVGWYKEEALTNEFNVKTETIKTITNLYAKFDLVEYSITYVLEADEINSSINPSKYTIETITFTLGNPSKEGYKFIGWFSDAKYQNKVEVINNGSTGNIELYPLFKEIVELIFKVDNETVKTIVVSDGEQIEYPTAPEKEGYDFGDWYYENGLAFALDDQIIHTTIVHAEFSPKKYEVVFFVDGNEIDRTEIEYNSYIGDLGDEPTKTGYKFVGWYKEAALVNEFDLENDVVLGNLNLYAKFEIINYSITYDLDGGTNNENNPSTYTIENEITFENAIKEGYDFAGWMSADGAPITKIEKGTTGNQSIKATYTIKKFTVTYYNGNTECGTETVEYNSLATGPKTNPTKEHYEFVGWYKEAELKTEFDFAEDKILDNTSLYAKFEVHNYSIEYVLNGGTNDKDNPSTYNVLNYVDLKGATKEGYRFDGWYDNANFDGDTVDLLGLLPGVQLEDIVLYAKFTKIITITFKVDGNVTETINVHDGDKLELPADPTKDHYVFDGWYNGETKVTQEALTKINESTELKAKWIVEKYTVSYFVKGEEKPRETEIVEYNNLATGPKASIEKDGYYFDGWYSNESCTDDFDLSRNKITDDIDLYGQFVELSDDINVLEIVGANEVAYLKIAIVNGYTINDYKVSYLLNNDFVSINSNLVRFIDENNDGKNDYVRADILGLKAGKYTVKVELGEASTTKNTVVSAQDRSGYAHFNYPNGVGAYNNDGTLKDNAVVVYVNEQNKNTVEATIGGKTKIGISAILQAATTGTPVDVRIIGTVGAATWKPLTVSSYSSASTTTVRGANGQYLALQNYDETAIINGGFNELDETIYSKLNGLSNKIKYDSNKEEFDSYYNMLDISKAQNVTIEGVGDDARIFQWGITWKSCTSIEVKNLTFDDYTEDACSFEGSDDSTTISGFTTGHLWLHHNTFERGVNYWDVCSEQDKHDGDGATDFKKLAYVTIAYNHYINNHKTGLVGGSDTQHTACLTFHHNFYDTCQARLPFARQANMHMYNNYYYNSTGNNMQIYAGAYAFIENCYFKNTKNTFSLKTSDGKVAAVKSFNNIFDSCQSTGATIVTSRTEAVTNGNLYGQTFDTNSTIFYYDAANEKSNVSIMNEAEDVPAYVALHAGAGSGYYLSLNLYEEPVESFNVTFKYVINNQENVYNTLSVVSGGTVVAPSFELEGYEFLGWYSDANCSTAFDASNEITASISVYAKLRKLVEYTVDFVYNLGQDDIAISQSTIYEGNKVSKPSNPSLVGYKFINWYTDTDYQTLFDFDNVINKNTVVYAKFEEVNVVVTYLKFDEATAGDYTADLELTNGLTVHANSDKKVSIGSDSKTCGDVSVSKYLSLGGSGTTAYRSIEFNMPKAGSVLVYYNASSGRHLVLNNGTTTASSDDTTGSLQAYTFENVAAGTYYLYSANSGINVYLIATIVENTNTNPDPADYEKLELCYYYTARNTQKNTSYNNGQYPSKHVKTLYKVGEQFDSSYLSAIVNNNYVTTGFEFSGFDSTTTGTKTITVTYGNYQTTFDVYVLPVDFEVASSDEGYHVMVGSSYEVGGEVKSSNVPFTTFKTINQALDALEMVTPTATKRAYLCIAAGYYKEKVVINVPYLTITGTGIAKATYAQDESYDAVDLARATVIEWDSLYGTTTEGNGSTGSNNLHVTDSTQTVYITEKAVNCALQSLTISNANNCYAYFTDVVKSHAEHRALALLVQADMVRFDNVALLGYQDTVEFFTGRHYLYSCYISGATDYIFGTNGTTFIQKSTIHTVYNGSTAQGGYVNAFKGQNASSSDSIEYGCIYYDCTFEADSNVTDGIIALGRPWTESSAVMIMNSHISAKYSKAATASSSVGRYCDWNSSIKAANAKFYEYNNDGDGAIESSITGCTVVSKSVADNFADINVIFGKTNGNVKYNNVWDGTTNPIEDTNIYYYFDGTATDNGYTFTGTVQGSTAKLGDLNIDATNGKLYARSSDTQMTAGTVITFTVTKASTVTITFNHWQEAYTVNGVASTSGVYTIQVEAGTIITFTATAESYLKSIIIS